MWVCAAGAGSQQDIIATLVPCLQAVTLYQSASAALPPGTGSDTTGSSASTTAGCTSHRASPFPHCKPWWTTIQVWPSLPTGQRASLSWEAQAGSWSSAQIHTLSCRGFTRAASGGAGKSSPGSTSQAGAGTCSAPARACAWRPSLSHDGVLAHPDVHGEVVAQSTLDCTPASETTTWGSQAVRFGDHLPHPVS